MALCVRLQPEASLTNGAMLTNTRHNILQTTTLWPVVKHIICSEQRHTTPHRQGSESRQTAHIIRTIKARHAQPDIACKLLCQPGQIICKPFARHARRHGNEANPGSMKENVVHREITRPLGRTTIPKGQQPAQARISRAIRRIGDNLKPILRNKPYPGQKAEPVFLCSFMRPYNTRKCIAISQTNGIDPKHLCRRDKFISMRRTA